MHAGPGNVNECRKTMSTDECKALILQTGTVAMRLSTIILCDRLALVGFWHRGRRMMPLDLILLVEHNISQKPHCAGASYSLLEYLKMASLAGETKQVRLCDRERSCRLGCRQANQNTPCLSMADHHYSRLAAPLRSPLQWAILRVGIGWCGNLVCVMVSNRMPASRSCSISRTDPVIFCYAFREKCPSSISIVSRHSARLRREAEEHRVH